MQWTTTPVGCWCGYCGVRLQAGDEIALVTNLRKIRCATCARRSRLRVVVATDDGDDLPFDDTPPAPATDRGGWWKP